MFGPTTSLSPRNRRHTRHIVGLYSELVIDGLHYRCHVVDLSIGGARLSDVIVAVGEEVTLYIGTSGIERAILAQVMWTRGNQAGLKFRQDLPQG